MKNILYVGIDDTDSSEGMCTTYIGALVMDELKHYGFQLKGHPRLIRLNPFAPFKTRGNGAISFNLSLNCSDYIKTNQQVPTYFFVVEILMKYGKTGRLRSGAS